MMKRNQFIISQLLLRSSFSSSSSLSSQVQPPLQSLIAITSHKIYSFPKPPPSSPPSTTAILIPPSNVTFPQTLIPTIKNPTRSTIFKIPIPRKPDVVRVPFNAVKPLLHSPLQSDRREKDKEVISMWSSFVCTCVSGRGGEGDRSRSRSMRTEKKRLTNTTAMATRRATMEWAFWEKRFLLLDLKRREVGDWYWCWNWCWYWSFLYYRWRISVCLSVCLLQLEIL